MSSLKEKTKGAIKWNLVDKIAAQILYAVTGIILARLISKEDFGLVGAVLVFQAFASMFVDSGFASALIQRKAPSERDYSTVFWFNMLKALALFII
ncbi:MAG: oligosaccharide flippase family protein, partial [Muribaculaceae bacterium]|nr:oligosaccharide flippase family protein [Muribaculaceae bacterium]